MRGSLTHPICTPCLPTTPGRAVWMAVAGAAGREPHLLAGAEGLFFLSLHTGSNACGSRVCGN